MELLIIIAVIIGLVLLVNHGEKEKRIRIHGYDWKKPDNQRTQDERNFINKKRQDEEIMKEFNYIQQGLKMREHDIKVHITEHGMTQHAIEEMKVYVMSLDAFQEYANRLPSNLRNELMNAAKAETYARAKSKIAKVSFYGLDEVVELTKHKEAFAKLFEVMNKCKQFNETPNNMIETKHSSKAEHKPYSDDLFS